MPNVFERNNVRVFGDGRRTLLFAHGFGCDQNMWRFLTPAFEHDHRIVLFDYVGSGRSDLGAYSADRYGELEGYADDILDVRRALPAEDEVVLVGHSVSGMIGALAAIREPSLFRALVFVSPSPRYIDDPPDYVGGFARADIDELLATMDRNYIGWATALAPAIMGNPDQPALGAELTESFCSTDPVIARRFAEATFYADNRGDLPQVPVPSLILQCVDDIIAPVSVGEYVHRHTPNSTLRVMRATGHCPHMSAPEETARLMRSFLEGLQG